jgi:hypothetical protein
VSAAVVSVDGAAGGVVLSFRDEAELRAYFALELPPPPGARSPFGAMCDRLASGRNPKTKELPSAGASWTEIIECGWTKSSTHDGEDAFVAYVDERRFVKRVEARLARLTAHERDVLCAHYTDRDVTALTPTAIRENRERAARGRHETVDETVASTRREVKNPRAPKVARDTARARASLLRREVAFELRSAREAYAPGSSPQAPRGHAR